MSIKSLQPSEKAMIVCWLLVLRSWLLLLISQLLKF